MLDVITIEKTGENFRLLYDVKGRFAVHRISEEEAQVCTECVKKAVRCLWELCHYLSEL